MLRITLRLHNALMLWFSGSRIGWVDAVLDEPTRTDAPMPCVAMVTLCKSRRGLDALMIGEVDGYIVAVQAVYPYAPWAVLPVNLAEDGGESCADQPINVCLDAIEVEGSPAQWFHLAARR
jgi:hypothetical protein